MSESEKLYSSSVATLIDLSDVSSVNPPLNAKFPNVSTYIRENLLNLRETSESPLPESAGSASTFGFSFSDSEFDAESRFSDSDSYPVNKKNSVDLSEGKHSRAYTRTSVENDDLKKVRVGSITPADVIERDVGILNKIDFSVEEKLGKIQPQPELAKPKLYREWNAGVFFSQGNESAGSVEKRDGSAPSSSTALIILNQPLCSLRWFERIWNSVSIRICADGGANRLFDAFSSESERERFLPDFICGDLDSARTDVLEWYSSRNVNVIQSNCQDTTDFQKCLKQLSELEKEKRNFYDIIAFGALGGRFDQSLSSIHMLHKLGESRRVYLASIDSIAFLLLPGHHKIVCNKKIEGPTCGILPIGINEAKVITKGLKWNIDHSMPLSFGKLVTTSNAFEDTDDEFAHIEVETNEAVVWTVEVQLK